MINHLPPVEARCIAIEPGFGGGCAKPKHAGHDHIDVFGEEWTDPLTVEYCEVAAADTEGYAEMAEWMATEGRVVTARAFRGRSVIYRTDIETREGEG